MMAINGGRSTALSHFVKTLIMSKRMLKYKSELKLLATCLPSTARLLFNRAPKDFIRAIVDVTWTSLSGKINFTPDQLKQVKSLLVDRHLTNDVVYWQLRVVLKPFKSL